VADRLERIEKDLEEIKNQIRGLKDES